MPLKINQGIFILLKVLPNLNIKMIMWGEDGESMYGGNNSQKNKI